MMAVTPIGEAAMSLLFHLIVCLFPLFGVVTDLDGDGVKTYLDCDDSDPSLYVEWCFDGTGDGVPDCLTPVPNPCLPPDGFPVDSRYVVCTCPEFGR